MRGVLCTFFAIGLIVLSADPASARTKVNYWFATTLIPDGSFEEVQRVEFGQSIWKGALIPYKAGRLGDEVALSGSKIVLPEGTIVALANSRYLIGCEIQRLQGNPFSDRHVCLIDRNGDGKFDGWFKRGNDVVFDASVSRIFLDKVRDATSTSILAVEDRDSSELIGRLGINVSVRKTGFSVCRTYRDRVEAFCVRGVQKKKIGMDWTQFDIMGGRIQARMIDEERVEVRTLRAIPKQRFDGNSG